MYDTKPSTFLPHCTFPSVCESTCANFRFLGATCKSFCREEGLGVLLLIIFTNVIHLQYFFLQSFKKPTTKNKQIDKNRHPVYTWRELIVHKTLERQPQWVVHHVNALCMPTSNQASTYFHRQLKHFEFSYMFCAGFAIHVYFISKAFISNTKLTAAKNQVKVKHHPEAEVFSIWKSILFFVHVIIQT